ncbi:MAG TPA: pitrilysin family protein [Rhodocyclaceae bacterium]|nr:pitrilysin family protein [Rhodocyclaceae bacterium]
MTDLPMRVLKSSLSLFVVLALSLTAQAETDTPNSSSTAAPTNTYETKLPNGLRVIVREDHRAPVVVNMIWYHVGSIDEKDGDSGLSHALEHLMFKRTTHHATGEFNRLVAEAGGVDNAFTNLDYTAYYQNVPKTALPEMMALEADRMQNLAFTKDEFSSEMKVVMEERRMRTEDNPQARVYEATNAAAFQASPYRRPVIGWMNDLENMTWQDAMNWHKAWYTPANAYVVIVGDVNKDDVFKLAQKYFGSIPSHALPVEKPQVEPPQLGIRRVTVKVPASLPYILMEWKVPKLKDVNKDVDPYALQVLSAVLDGHDAARLSKDLVRGQRIAQSAGAEYDPVVRGEAMFLMDGQPADGHTVAELEAALKGEIRQIQDQGVSAEELGRVKVQLIASQVYKRDSMMAQAMEIGGIESAGLGWRDIDTLLAKLKEVTPEQVQAVARKYFSDDTLTVGVLDPQPIDPNAPKRPAMALPSY